MSAVEEIEAAVAKLTKLRDESVLGPWEGWKQYNPLRGNLYGIEARGAEVAKTYTVADTELIETLHRTIDAQLKLLSGTLRLFAAAVDLGREREWLSAVERAGDLDLARSINATS